MADQDILWDLLIKKSEEELSRDDYSADVSSAKPSIQDTSSLLLVRDTDARDINAFIDAIAQSHNCNVDDVIFYCDPVAGDDGKVKIEEVLLKFSIRSLDHGKINDRIVHTMSIKTTQEVQQLARAMLEQDAIHVPAQVPAQVSAPAQVPAPAAPASQCPDTSRTTAKPKRKRAIKMKPAQP